MWLFLLLILSILFIIITTSRLKWHPFFALLIAAIGFGLLSGTMQPNQVISSVNTGFGNTIGYIGIVILAGSIIGKFLEKTGGARRIAHHALKMTGRKNVPLALSIVGYIVSIPVFCDSAFIILIPLAKALSRQVRISMIVSAMALSLGLYVTHSVIPPTPGPVAAAGLLEADLGWVILLGLPVSLAGLLAGWLYAVKMIPAMKYSMPSEENREEISGEELGDAPSLIKSVIPILLPILLIVLRSVSELPNHPFGEATAAVIISFIGQPVVALMIGVLFSFLLPRKLTSSMLSGTGWLGEGVLAAASIIIITGCGGAFGRVLQDSGISVIIEENIGHVKGLSILLPVLIAAALKSAQGSGTVAIITTASLVAPMLISLGLDSTMARALVVVAIGSGSMMASHANDSYFWVVTQFSGMTVNQGYKFQTLGTLFVGIISVMATWILYILIL
ncbi:MAG: GntP family permease [Cyclobacteriaceae bacterium]|nr:GntP family permease [Cyclobacteriaceae bacterium]